MPEIIEKTGLPPIEIDSAGLNLIDWSITGNANGVGHLVTNIFDGKLVNKKRYTYGEWAEGVYYVSNESFIAVEPDSDYSMRFYSEVIDTTRAIYIWLYDAPILTRDHFRGQHPIYNGGTFHTTATTYYIVFTFGSDGEPECVKENVNGIMINKGSRVYPYCAPGESYYLIPLTVTSNSDSNIYDFVLDAPLGAEDSISLESTGVSIPTTFGRNVIDVEDVLEELPTIYVKYQQALIYAAERPEQVSIYDVTEPQLGFNHNGVAVLMPFEITSQKEDKGRWDLTMKHPIDPYGKWTYIAGQNILKVRGQLYRIDQLEIIAEQNKELIQAHANHISYDLKDWWIEEAEFEVNNGNDYIAQLNAHKVTEFPNQQPVVGEYSFNVTSNLSKNMKAALKDQSFIEALYGADNSMVNRYGGEVYRNNFNMSINSTMEGAPSGNAFNIRYGTDMTKINFKIDYSDWITNLICVDNLGGLWATWYSGDFLPHHHKTKRVHFTYEALDSPDAEMQRLIADGEAYWAQVSVPQVSVDVNIAYIKADPKYKDFLNLQNVDVGYTGKIYVEHLGIDVDMKVTAIKRNELTGEILSVKLGNSRKSLIRSTVMSQTIVSPNSVEGKNTLNNQTMQEEIYDSQTRLMSESIAGMETFQISDLEGRTINELEGV